MADTYFKTYAHQPRVMTVEDSFSKGIEFSDNPHDKDSYKLLVNYDLKNSGKTLTPRGGIVIQKPDVFSSLSMVADRVKLHHCGVCNVYTDDTYTDFTPRRYALYTMYGSFDSGDVTFNIPDTQGYLSWAYIMIEKDDGTYNSSIVVTDPLDADNFFACDYKTHLTSVHGLPLTETSPDGYGRYASINSTTFIPGYNLADGKYYLFHLLVYEEELENGSMSLQAQLHKLEPYDAKASTVINTGYNMLKEDPYSFTVDFTTVATLQPEGIVPYDSDGKVALKQKLGQDITFKLYYKYPTDLALATLNVLWKIKNLGDSSETRCLNNLRTSPCLVAVADHAPAVFGYKVAYKQYTIIAEIYNQADVTGHAYVSDEDDYKNLRPVATCTVSNYYGSSDINKSNDNLKMMNYDLAQCDGMCVWQQRLVLWGVYGALSTIWLSQPNQPEYFPYPNNVEVLSEEIIHCVPYMDDLLIFTKSKLYRMSAAFDASGNVYYQTKCIQERLIMTKEDASTILVVKNMVYFKSGAYFYMIVPSSNTINQLQIAPISRPVTQLYDNFKETVADIIDKLYSINDVLDLKTNHGTKELTFLGFNDYLDGDTIRNVYRTKLAVTIGTTTTDYYFSFVMNYDTNNRAWTTYLYQSGKINMLPYEYSITDGIRYIVRNTNNADIVQFSKTTNVDSNNLLGATRLIPNYQMLDTGNRNHLKDWKKRFRELQFTISNLSKETLKFATSFILDDEMRKNLYDYKISQVTDKTDPNYGTLFVERSLKESVAVPDVATFWADSGVTFDFSKFDDITVFKVRFHVSGKGYNGRMILISNNEKNYELLGINWVYRVMYGR